MTLMDLVTPVFMFVVALRRKIRRGVTLEYSDVKREVLSLFSRLESQAASKSITDRWNRAKIALTYLVDEVGTMETWSGQNTWNNHSLEVEYLGHTEKMRGAWFYDDEYKYAMESGDVEYMHILYLCLALGFEGKYRGQSVQLKNHMDNLYSRLPKVRRDFETDERMFPGCYFVDKTANNPRMPMQIATVAAVFVGIIVTYFAVNYYAYNQFMKDLTVLATKIEEKQ